MMHEHDQVLINHILDAADAIVSFVGTRTFANFLDDDLVVSAVIRKFEIIGEAANKLSTQAKSELSSIPWKNIIGMRNVLIHDYTGVDIEGLWNTIEKSLPILMQELSPFRFKK